MAVAFVAQAVTIGLTIIPFGLFATPMVEEFGLSIASVTSRTRALHRGSDRHKRGYRSSA